MQKLVIKGGRRLEGEIAVQGAKNSALPIAAASLLCEGVSILENCPRLSDVYAACRILTNLGCHCEMQGNAVTVDSCTMHASEIPEQFMCEMRSSIIFLGAVLGRMGKCTLGYPGGCELGPRPINLHLQALRRMGVKIREENGILHCSTPNGLHGAKIHLRFPSVGATENVLLAAVTASGETTISNAAREPEIVDLVCYLRSCGACISGEGTGTLVIRGVKRLTGCTYRIMPDRIVAATWLAAAAATGGEILLRHVRSSDMTSILDVFEEMNCHVSTADETIHFHAGKNIRPVGLLKTMPYPGFPTDAQAIMMAALCHACGTTLVEETIFENRFRHVDALVKMGADIQVAGRVAAIHGVRSLHGATVEATDLRGGAAMMIAGLSACGETIIQDVYHIDRGYDCPEEVLRNIGAEITRI